MKKVALITGASAGIGKETAKQLLLNGYTVYGLARRLKSMEDIRQLGAQTLRLDICDDAAIVQAIADIIRAETHIDVLINNAGFGSYGALEDVPLSDARYQFEVNVFGLMRITQLVIPYMRQQGSGTIINISSIGGKLALPLGGWYHATKYAVEALSDSLRLELKPFGINVVVIEPGGIQTEWTGITADNALKNSGDTVYKDWAVKMTDNFKKFDHHLSPPSLIAKLIVRVLRTKNPGARYSAGFMSGPMLFMKKVLPDRWFDGMIGTQFK
jgi:short-subunit dehydrogenase